MTMELAGDLPYLTDDMNKSVKLFLDSFQGNA